ncbi:hypothetical protein V6C27_13105 [Peptococcaceae bacterium 1198_IL3148]
MDKYIIVIKQIIGLAETALEGLEHIKLKLGEGHYEATDPLLADVLQALGATEKSLQPMASQLLPNQLSNCPNYCMQILILLFLPTNGRIRHVTRCWWWID